MNDSARIRLFMGIVFESSFEGRTDPQRFNAQNIDRQLSQAVQYVPYQSPFRKLL
jgi:hypothetical protein